MLEWLSQSPDWNSFENLWQYLTTYVPKLFHFHLFAKKIRQIFFYRCSFLEYVETLDIFRQGEKEVQEVHLEFEVVWVLGQDVSLLSPFFPVTVHFSTCRTYYTHLVTWKPGFVWVKATKRMTASSKTVFPSPSGFYKKKKKICMHHYQILAMQIKKMRFCKNKMRSIWHSAVSNAVQILTWHFFTKAMIPSLALLSL